MKSHNRLIGRRVTDIHGQKMGIVVAVHPQKYSLLRIVYWNRFAKDYHIDYWETAEINRIPLYNLEPENKTNEDDPEYEETRILALADAAVIIGDKEMFFEAFGKTGKKIQ